MADEFDLTPRPIRVTGPTRQSLQDALDISEYDVIDAVCTVDGVEGSTTGLAIRLMTGMQKETEAGWIELVPFVANNLTANASDAVHADKKLLKYLRWDVTGLNTATAIVFDISGMLRKHG